MVSSGSWYFPQISVLKTFWLLRKVLNLTFWIGNPDYILAIDVHIVLDRVSEAAVLEVSGGRKSASL